MSLHHLAIMTKPSLSCLLCFLCMMAIPIFPFLKFKEFLIYLYTKGLGPFVTYSGKLSREPFFRGFRTMRVFSAKFCGRGVQFGGVTVLRACAVICLANHLALTAWGRKSLLKFFKPNNPNLPKPEGCLATVTPSSSIVAATREVKKVNLQNRQQGAEPTNTSLSRWHGRICPVAAFHNIFVHVVTPHDGLYRVGAA